MDIQKGWVEQRKFERVSTTLAVSYKVLSHEEKKDAIDLPRYKETKAEHLPNLSRKFHVYHAITRDISEGGLSLMGDQPFYLGDQVEIHMQIPQYKTQLTLLAEVLRVSSFLETGKTMHSAGVKIMAINREDVVRLEKYLLTEKLKQQNGKR